MVKRALLVGCNYPGQACELKGAVNDIDRMRILLIKRFGFNPKEILELVDGDPRSPQPTGANIRKCLGKLVHDVEPGDVFFFHFSGHGCQVPSERGRSDDTGYEECIVPSDMNLLTDDDFRDLVDRIPPGVNFTFIADACHSGGLIDSEKEQIGDQYSGGRPIVGGRPRPPGLGRPAAGGGGGLLDLAAEGVEAYASSAGGGRGKREFDPQEIDAYARQPDSTYERPERPYVRRDPRDGEAGSYEDGGGYDRREGRASDRPYAGSGYGAQYMKKTPVMPTTGYADGPYMQSGSSVPEGGYADRGFGYSSSERPYDRSGNPYSDSGYAPEPPPFPRPVTDDYGFPSPGAALYDRPPIPADDEFGLPSRGAPYERPVRPADDDYSYPARPVRPLDEDYRYASEGASRRPEKGSYGLSGEDAYGRASLEDPYDRYGGERRQGYDSREDEVRRGGTGRYGEGSSYEESSRYPAKYPSEYAGSGGKYGGFREPGDDRYGDHGYSGKPHHTPLKNKSLPVELLTDILSQRTGQNVKLGNIHRTLYDLFGEDASPTVKYFVNVFLNNFEGSTGVMGKIGDLASQLMKTKVDHGSGSPTGGGGYGGYPGNRFNMSSEEDFDRNRRRRRRNYDAGILVSACEPYETSADANPTDNFRDAYGALSNAIQTIIGESRAPLTNRQVVMAARKLLSQQGYRQHPCLYCSDRNADALFLTPV